VSTLRRNTIANIVGQAWNGIVAAVAIPAQIHFLGMEAFGLLGFLTSLQSFLSVVDVGLSTTVNRALAGPGSASQDVTRDRRLVRTLELVYVALGAAVAALFGVAGLTVPSLWLQHSSLSKTTLATAFLVFGISVGVRWPVSLYSGVLRGKERHVLLNGLASGCATVRLGGGIAVLAAGGSLGSYLVWTAIAGVLEAGAMSLAAWSSLPPDELGATRPSIRLLRGIWRFAASVTTISIFALILKQTDKLLVARLLPLEQVGYYTVAVLLSRVILMWPSAVFSAVFPRFTSYVSEGRQNELSQLFHRSARAVSFGAAPIGAAFVLFPADILWAWTRSELVARGAAAPLAGLSFGMMLNSAMQIPFALQLGGGLTHIALWNNVLSSVLMVPLIWILVRSFGLFGASAAWIVFNAVYFLLIPQLTHRHLLRGEKADWYFRDTLPFWVGAVATFGGAAFLSSGASHGVRLAAASAAGASYLALMLMSMPSLRSWGLGLSLLRTRQPSLGDPASSAARLGASD
jgi:O-antigen/teichoic acid export membrane protein